MVSEEKYEVFFLKKGLMAIHYLKPDLTTISLQEKEKHAIP
jgi:hypothetical protein